MTFNIPNSTNIVTFNQQLSAEVSYLYPSILLFIFLIISGGGYLIQHNRTQRGKISSSLVIGGIVTTLIAVIMAIVGGLIPIDIVYICAGATAIFILISLFDVD